MEFQNSVFQNSDRNSEFQNSELSNLEFQNKSFKISINNSNIKSVKIWSSPKNSESHLNQNLKFRIQKFVIPKSGL